jgi:hypothetical protein
LFANGQLALLQTIASAGVASTIRAVLAHLAVAARVLSLRVLVIRRLHHGAFYDSLINSFLL